MSTSEPRRATILAVDDEPTVLAAVAPLPAPRVGDTVRLRIEGGVRFPATPATGPLDEFAMLTT